MEITEVALYLRPHDILVIPDLSMRFAKGVLKDETRRIANNCEDSVRFLLQNFSPWNPVTWVWKTGEQEYTDTTDLILIRLNVFTQLVSYPDYADVVLKRYQSLPEKIRRRFLKNKNLVLDIAWMMACETDNSEIRIDRNHHIYRGRLYVNDHPITDTFKETFESVITVLNHRKVPKFLIGGVRYDKPRPNREKEGLFPPLFQYLLREKSKNLERRHISRGEKDPKIVRDFYAKDCTDNNEEFECSCTPTISDAKECSFSDSPLVTDMKEKLDILGDSGTSELARPERLSYIEEFPIFVLKKGTVLCHSTKRGSIIGYDPDTESFYTREGSIGWWNKYFVGQSKYGGGWFTYETNYGGPEFGMLLYYRVEEDIPLLFVPNYRLHVGDPAYYPDKKLPWYQKKKKGKEYTGSHILQGPKNWKEKGYEPIVETFFADKFVEKILNLGFSGYISCDECEVFISHSAMKKGLKRPFKVKYELEGKRENYPEDFETIFDGIIKLLCEPGDDSCSLQIKAGDRDEKGKTITLQRELIEKILPLKRFQERYTLEE